MTAHQPRAVPRDGLANPMFDDMGTSDDLIVSMSFSPGLTNAQMHVVYRWVRELGGREGSTFAAAEPFVHEYLFHARLSGLADPRGAVRRLQDELLGCGVQIKDSFYACWRWRPNGVMGPRPDPRAPVEAAAAATAREYLDRLWSPDGPPPPSELEPDLKGGFLSQDELILEHRGAPLYLPGLRIGYGTAPFTPVGEDDRTSQVCGTLVESLTIGWETLFKAPGKGHTRPQPLDQAGEVDRIQKILCGTRVGYHFSVEAAQLLDRPSPHTCRFREYELMEAVLDAVTKTGLAPVVTWQRYGTPLLIGPIKRPDVVDVQLWEHGGDHSTQPDLDRPHPRP